MLEGPFEFDTSILVSALRIATAYDYPDLYSYAIKHLECAKLVAIERIKIAREFELTAWEEPAYVELCERDEPITNEEASALGMDTFVHIAGIREREQRRRGREIDVCKERETGCKGLEGEGNAKEGGESQKEDRDGEETSNLLPKDGTRGLLKGLIVSSRLHDASPRSHPKHHGDSVLR